MTTVSRSTFKSSCTFAYLALWIAGTVLVQPVLGQSVAPIRQPRLLAALAGNWKSESPKPGGPPSFVITVTGETATVTLMSAPKSVVAKVFSSSPRDAKRQNVMALVLGDTEGANTMTVLSPLGTDRILLEMFFAYTDSRSSFYFADTFRKQ